MESKPQLRETIPHHTQSVPFSVHHIAFEAPDALYLHWHPEFEFLLVKTGTIEMTIEDQTLMLQAGECVFIPPSLLHRAKSAQNGTFEAFVADPEWISGSRSNSIWQKYVRPVCSGSVRYVYHICPNSAWENTILSLLRTIFSVPEALAAEQNLLIQGSLLLIWQYLYEHHIRQLSQGSAGERMENQLSDVLACIHGSYANDLTLPQLAALAHMSEGQFCRQFKLLTGMTPFHYLNHHRVLQSCRLLSETDKKISEIATLCGFNTISYFNRKFMEMTGMTPSAYRKNKNMERNYL